MARKIKNSDTKPRVVPPRTGYDEIASYYQQWRWYWFWRRNEAPVITGWLRSLPPGYGLDAGSGTGPYMGQIGDLDHRCVALDVSLQMLKINRHDADLANPGAGLGYVQGDVTALPFTSEAFDWILCTRALSHVADLESALGEFTRVLKAGGTCLISDVHPEHPYNYVTIPHNEAEVVIETHKHSFAKVRTYLSTAKNLHLERLQEYKLADLAEQPPRDEFAKLYQHPDRSIFYVCRLEKRA